jgi:putative flippase GtrA
MTTIVNQFVKFAGVGIIGTAVHYILLIVFVEVFGRDPVSGSAVGFLGGAIVNYYLNRHYTFRSDARHMVAMPKFLTVATIGMILNVTIMAILTNLLDFQYLIDQIFATSVVLVWNFIANKFWTFASSQ